MAMAMWVSPVPVSTVWWVSSSRRTSSVGSSSCKRCRAVIILSSSALLLGRMATDSTGVVASASQPEPPVPVGARAVEARLTGMLRGVRVSPVFVAASLATAPKSPAATSVRGICSLPRRVKMRCSRSSDLALGLNSAASGRTVPERTLKRDILPT